MAINQRKAGTILSYAHLITSNTISLIYTPFMLRMLGQSEYGLFGTASSLTSYLSFFSFGIAGAYIKFNSMYRARNDKEGEARLNGMFITIFSVLSALLLIVGAVLILCADSIFGNGLTGEEIEKVKVIMTLTVCQYAVTFMFNTVSLSIMAYERFFFIKMCLLICGIVQPIINVIVLLLGGKAIAISVISLIVSVVTYGTYFVYAKKVINMKFIFHGFDKLLLKSVFVFSGFLFLNTITDQITQSTDTLLLGMYAGTSAVAIYTVGSSFGRYFTSFSTSVSSVFAPQVNRIIAEGKSNQYEELNGIFLRIGRVQCLILTFVLIGYIIFGLQFVNLWAGEEYGFSSFFIGLCLLLSFYIPLFQNVGLEIQKAKNLHKARSIAYFLVALFNIVLTVIVVLFINNYFSGEPDKIQSYAGVGAAIATLFCYLCGNTVFMNLYYHKKVGLNMFYFWKGILKLVPGFILPTIFGYFIAYIIPITSYKMFLLDGIIFSIVYFVSIWFLSMNKYEKGLVKAPINKIVARIKK